MTLFCAYHLYIFNVNQSISSMETLSSINFVHARKNHPTFPNLSNSPDFVHPNVSFPKKKPTNLLHLLCAHSTSHRTKAIPSLATAAPKANGGAIQGTVGRPTARQPIRGHREHRRVQLPTQQEVRGNARLARWVGPYGISPSVKLKWSEIYNPYKWPKIPWLTVVINPIYNMAFGLLWRLKEKKLGRQEVGFPHQELGILKVIKI